MSGRTQAFHDASVRAGKNRRLDESIVAAVGEANAGLSYPYDTDEKGLIELRVKVTPEEAARARHVYRRLLA